MTRPGTVRTTGGHVRKQFGQSIDDQKRISLNAVRRAKSKLAKKGKKR